MNENKVKQPYLFRITYKGKKALIIGTQHNLGMDILPVHCLEQIRSCTRCVTEARENTSYELKKFAQNFMLNFSRLASDLDWKKGLSADQFAIVQKSFAAVEPWIFGTWKVNKLDIGSLRVGAIAEVLELHACDFVPVETGIMDQQLSDLLNGPDIELGLEDPWTILFFSSVMEVEIEDLLDLISAIHKLENGEGINQIADMYDLEYFSKRYMAGADLLDYSFVYWRKFCDDGEHFTRRMRNIIFTRNILQHIDAYSGQCLFAFGGGHLLGEHGLFMNFKRLGIKLEIFDPNSKSADPYVKFDYLYDLNLKAYNYIKSDILGKKTPTMLAHFSSLANQAYARDVLRTYPSKAQCLLG